MAKQKTSVAGLLASALGQRDESPNIALAESVVKQHDAKAVSELINLLSDKSKPLQSDAIKVLYEIGEREPELIDEYAESFLPLLNNRNNRLQWGAMTALDSITATRPEFIFKSLPQILEAARVGSAITRDHAVTILIKLAQLNKYRDAAVALLLEQIENSPENQLPMYAERAVPVIPPDTKAEFIRILKDRLDSIEKESKERRILAVIRKMSKPS